MLTSLPTRPRYDEQLETYADALLREPARAPWIVHELAIQLRREKLNLQPAEWHTRIAQMRRHRLCALLHEDPLSHRAFSQPRGYQGDAELLDMIYSESYNGLCTDPSPLGREIFAYTIRCQAPEAVRRRKDLLATRLEMVCAENPRADILSVACGHLREVRDAKCMWARCGGRMVGLDQDPISVGEVRNSLGGIGVEGVCGTIRALFGGPLSRQRFDFIYSSGLYDYLDEPMARRLTERMLGMLTSNGRLLIANYAPGIADVGYMECFMGWTLVYRSPAQMMELLPQHSRGRASTSIIANGAVVVLELR
jgi:extracellular factor (EF) 3-hydroxypalmitic acid methyl ester biosynthesis protein